jgi:hypothetical protein
LTTLVSSLNKEQAAMTRRLKTGGPNCHKNSATVAKGGRSKQEEIHSLLEENIECKVEGKVFIYTLG